MNTIKLSLSLLLILAASLLPAQDIPKGANTVIISGEFSQGQKYAEITGILFEGGIGITSSDKELGTVTTAPKSFKNGTLVFIILVRDSKVSVRGQWSWDQTITIYGVTSNPNDWSDVEYGGQKGSPKRNAWEAFMAVADQIPGEKEYLVK